MALGERLLDGGPGVQAPVLVDDRGARVDHGPDAERLPRDDADARAPVAGRRLGDTGHRHLLVARRHHLVAGGQVHPDLEPVHAAAPLADLRGRHLGVHDAPARGHPLHVAGADRALVSRGILVLELALQHVGHRLEPAMRMIGRALGLAGAVVCRPHLVEQQERIDEVQAWGRERPADDEAAAFELPVRGGHAFDVAAHLVLFLLWAPLRRRRAPATPAPSFARARARRLRAGPRPGPPGPTARRKGIVRARDRARARPDR